MTVVTECGTLSTPNELYVLNGPISSTATCLTVGANNITIDCRGHQISYATSITGYGVSSAGFNFTTVKNCKIVSPTRGWAYGIYYYQSNNGTIFNNTITTLGGYSYGIYLYTNSKYNNLSGNTITASATGIYLNLGANSNNINNNTITSLDSGIYLSSSANNILTNNNATSEQTISYMLQGASSSHYNNSIDTSNFAEGKRVNYTYNADNLVYDNVDFTKFGQVLFAWSRNITVTNSNFSGDSLSLSHTTSSTISNNRINTGTAYGIFLFSYSDNNNVKSNNITTSGGYGHGIYVYFGSKNNNINNNTIKISAVTAKGIYLRTSADFNNVTNNLITAISPSGSDGILLTSGSDNNVKNNTILISSTYGDGISLSSGANRNGIYNNTILTLSVESCGILIDSSSDNTILGNNVTSTQTNSYIISGTESAHYDNILDTTNLVGGKPLNYTYDVENLLFDHADFTNFGQVIFGWSRNITITNSNFSGESLSLSYTSASTLSNNILNASTGHGIYLSSSSNYNRIINNSITTSGNWSRGIYLTSNSNYNRIINNSITTSNWYGHGIQLSSISNNNATTNTITVSANNAQGIAVSGSGSNINNNITTGGYNGRGISLGSGSSNNNINNNIIHTSGSYPGSWGSIGIYLVTSSSNNINNNTITSTHRLGDGIRLYSGSNSNDINNNHITTSSGSPGIQLWLNSNGNTLNNNTITTYGNYGYGIWLYQNSNGNTLNNNTITTYGSNGYGIFLQSTTQGNVFSGMNVKTAGYSICLEDAVNSFTIYDSILNSSSLPDFHANYTVTGGTWNFTNVTRADRTPITISWDENVNGTLLMNWYLDVRVKMDGFGVPDANVTLNDNHSNTAFSENTTSNGRISRKTLPEYVRNDTSGTDYTWYSPYNLTIILEGYPTYNNRGVILSNNLFMDVEMNARVYIYYPIDYAAHISNITSINYTTLANGYCWYTIDEGATNSSSAVAGVNFTTNFGKGDYSSTKYNLTVYCNDTFQNPFKGNITFIVGDYNVAYEVNKMMAGDAGASDAFGRSVSVSGDYAVVGAPGQDEAGSNAGAAYVFRRNSSGHFEELHKITAGDTGAGDEFGFSVSVSGDTAVLGARYEDDAGSNAGAAYLFKLEDNCICPKSGDWTVRVDCILHGFRYNMPNYNIACLNTGSLAFEDYTNVTARRAFTPINHGCLFLDDTSRFILSGA